MMREPLPDTKAAATARRDQRLKAALKANMGRRKAQARERAPQDSAAEDSAAEDGDDKPGDPTVTDIDRE